MSAICPSELRSQITQKSAKCDSTTNTHPQLSKEGGHSGAESCCLLYLKKTAFTCLWGSGRSSGNASKHSALICTDMYGRTHLMLSGCCSDVNLAQKSSEDDACLYQARRHALWFSSCGQNAACKSSNIPEAHCSCLDSEAVTILRNCWHHNKLGRSQHPIETGKPLGDLSVEI